MRECFPEGGFPGSGVVLQKRASQPSPGLSPRDSREIPFQGGIFETEEQRNGGYVEHFSRFPLFLLPWMLTLVVLTGSGCLHFQKSPLDYATLGQTAAHIDGTDLRYVVSGPEGAPAVLLIHGFGSSLVVWQTLVPSLARDHRVVAVDLPGFGLSSKYPGDYRPEAQARRILTLLDQLGIEKTAVVAHSMGSLITLALALTAPERVGPLVLASPWVYEDQVPWGFRAARSPGAGEMIFGLWFEEHLDQRFAISFYEPERWVTQDMLDRAHQALRLPGTRAASLQVIRSLQMEEWDGRYGEISAPLLVIQGEEDRISLPASSRRLLTQVPRSTWEGIPACGHFPMLEAPDRFAFLVRDFLGRSAP